MNQKQASINALIRVPIVLSLYVALFAAIAQSEALADAPTSTNVMFLPSLAGVPGAYSTIQRNSNGVRASVHTEALTNQVYTMWIFIWNDAATHAGCDADADFCTPGTADCVIYGTGHLIGKSGNGNFSSSLQIGDTSRVFGGGNCSAGLTDARTAEIHLVVADHGELDPSQLPAAIKTPGPGVQAAVHKP